MPLSLCAAKVENPAPQQRHGAVCSSLARTGRPTCTVGWCLAVMADYRFSAQAISRASHRRPHPAPLQLHSSKIGAAFRLLPRIGAQFPNPSFEKKHLVSEVCDCFGAFGALGAEKSGLRARAYFGGSGGGDVLRIGRALLPYLPRAPHQTDCVHVFSGLPV